VKVSQVGKGDASFRGPWADGPPPAELEVHAPPLDRFGFEELRRMALTGLAQVWFVLRAVAVWTVRRRGRSLRTAAAEGLVDSFEALGPTFVKLGQLVASSPGLFPSFLADACLRCLDEVPPVDPATARSLLTHGLGRPPEEIFATFDPLPVSAASIAQVHACTLPDGRLAVLKVQRPDIAHRMNTDLRILRKLAGFLARTKVGKQSNAIAIIEDLHQVTNQELCCALEAHRQSMFRENLWAFGDNKAVTAPEVYWDYCGPGVICMERMTGIPMDETEMIRAQGVDTELLLRRGIKAWAEACMVHGPFHGDLHAGNLWVLEDGRSSFLDFGIMGELPDAWKTVLRELFTTSMIDSDYTRVVRAYQSVGVLPAGIDEDQVAVLLKMAVEPMLDQTLGETSLGETLKQNMALAEQFGAVTPKELVLISKQLLYFERYAKAMAPGYTLARDLYLIKNVLPDLVAAKCAADGIVLPD
jgi:predicted unusual protein kinase regulating ubiquinone biosynthesis (AarF/ABC1/UbiB family)